MWNCFWKHVHQVAAFIFGLDWVRTFACKVFLYLHHSCFYLKYFIETTLLSLHCNLCGKVSTNKRCYYKVMLLTVMLWNVYFLTFSFCSSCCSHQLKRNTRRSLSCKGTVGTMTCQPPGLPRRESGRSSVTLGGPAPLSGTSCYFDGAL